MVAILQAYTVGQSIINGANINFNSSAFETVGAVERGSDTSTVTLHKAGVYRVDFNATAVTTEAGTVGAQLYVRGVAQEEAQTAATTAAGASANISFSTLVSLSACNGFPRTVPLTVRYTGSEGTITAANIIITKVA